MVGSARDGGSLLSICRKHAEQDRIFTSFVGLGVNFGVEVSIYLNFSQQRV
jgi:hypothetical protein